jgi:two-component system OmpR family sensor kinase
MRRSIRLRLLIWVLVILVPAIAGAGWLLLQTFGQRLQRDTNVALREEAETIAELMATERGSEALTGLVAHVAGDPGPEARKYVAVMREHELLAEAPEGAHQLLETAGARLHVVRHRNSATGVAVTIGVAQAQSQLARRRLRSLLFAGVPLLIALAAGGLWLAVGMVLRPLETAATALQTMDPSDLSVRIPGHRTDDEVGRLVSVLNDTLARVERSMAELRRFSGDAAHALRTPLTVQRTGLEVALSKERSAADYRAALTDALTSAEQMSRIADRLLTLARLDAAEAPRAATAIDVAEVLRELADGFAASGTGSQAAIDLKTESDLWVLGDVADSYRLLSDVIDNAVRYGARNADVPAPVAVSAKRSDGWIEIVVADRGPGIAEEDLPHVFERFYRGRSRPSSDAGTGLGLSIAQRIVEAQEGKIHVANRSGGGCAVTIRLPAAQSDTARRTD